MTAMAAVICFSCGVEFHVPSEFDTNRRADKADFWCPNGHKQHYLGKTEAQKLQEQLDAKARSLAWTEERLKTAQQERDRNEARRRAEKAAKTVLRKKLYPEEFTKEPKP